MPSSALATALCVLLVCQQLLFGMGQSMVDSDKTCVNACQAANHNCAGLQQQLQSLQKQLHDQMAETMEHASACKNQRSKVSVCNVARGESAVQSSTQILNDPVHYSVVSQGPGLASRAVDGNKSPFWNDGSCAHTNQEVNPWWSVDLQSNVNVVAVGITNRGDCCSERLHDIRVSVTNVNPSITPPKPGSGSTCAYQTGPVGAGMVLSLTCPPHGVSGRYVIIQIISPGAEYLTLCEVEVYAECNYPPC